VSLADGCGIHPTNPTMIMCRLGLVAPRVLGEKKRGMLGDVDWKLEASQHSLISSDAGTKQKCSPHHFPYVPMIKKP